MNVGAGAGSSSQRSYLKRDFTPSNKSPTKFEYLTVVEEQKEAYAESPSLPLFKSISDKPQGGLRHQPTFALSEFPISPVRASSSKKDNVWESSVVLPTTPMEPRVFDSNASQTYYHEDNNHSSARPVKRFSFKPDYDSFAHTVNLNEGVFVKPAPPLDGGATMTAKLESYRKQIRPDVFRLTVERANDSWNSPRFALKENTSNDANEVNNRGDLSGTLEHSKAVGLRRVLFPISTSNAKAIEVSRSGETVFIIGSEGLTAHNMYSNIMLQSNSSRHISCSDVRRPALPVANRQLNNAVVFKR